MYEASLAQFAKLGASIVEIDIEPFYAAARLLYEGPWVAERYLTIRALIASSPESILPVTRQIILAGAHGTAADAFAAFYQLDDLRRVRDHTFRSIDAMVLPTAPTIYSIEQVQADPIALNSRLGTYTNFVNLLDMCGLAVPAAMRPDGTPFGVTLLAPAHERYRAGGHRPGVSCRDQIAARRTRLSAAAAGGKCTGTRVRRNSARRRWRASFGHAAERRVARARCAADRAGRQTAPHYRLYALPATKPPKPGLLRVKKGDGRRDCDRSLRAF